MARRPQPWYWKARRAWYVTIEGTRHRLAEERSEALARFHELMAHPIRRQAAGDSVVALIDRFLDWSLTNSSAATYAWYRRFLQAFIDTIPANLTARQLRPHHVQAWADAGAARSNSTRHARIRSVQRAMSWAVQQGLIAENPVARMKKPAPGRREAFLSPADFDRILTHVTDDAFRDVLIVAWETGARPQEITRVEARHVEADRSRWVFPQDEAKGKRRPRVIYLTAAAEEITLRRMQLHPEGPLFRNTAGRPWVKDALVCRFGRLKKELGQRFCLYHFRHSFATRKLREGLDPLTVAELLGHSDPSMLAKVYQHVAHDPQYMLTRLRQSGVTHPRMDMPQDLPSG